MVPDFPHLGEGRQDMGEVALPHCRVRPLPKAPHRRGVEDRLNAAPHPARGFRLLGPNRIEHLHNKAGVDRRNRQFPQSGVDVSGQGIFPLLPVLRIAPAYPVPLDELSGAFPEGAALRDGEALRLPLGSLGVERVDPVVGNFRCSVAFPRASASEISGRGPSPMSRRLPSSWNRKTHDLAPVAETRR